MSSLRWMSRTLLGIVPLVALLGAGWGPCDYDDVVSRVGGAGGAQGGGGSGGSGGGGMGGSGGTECVPQGKEICGNEVDEDCDTKKQTVSDCLINEGLVVRYFLDTFDKGVAEDSGPEPKLPLHAEDTTTDAGELLTFVNERPHRRLSWSTVGSDARVSAQFATGTTPLSKMQLTGGTVTIEVVIRVEASEIGTDSARILYVGPALRDKGKLSLSVGGIDAMDTRALQFHLNASDEPLLTRESFIAADELAQISVLHMVMDAASSRIDLYRNGVLRTDGTIAPPATDYAFTWDDAESYLVLGNKEAGGRSFNGSIYYAAMYTKAFSNDDAKANADLLLQVDDGSR